MAKANKQATPPPDKLAEKVSINVGFHEAMQILADHANDKNTKKITYKGRRRKGE